jgi:hypothetical protein
MSGIVKMSGVSITTATKILGAGRVKACGVAIASGGTYTLQQTTGDWTSPYPNDCNALGDASGDEYLAYTFVAGSSFNLRQVHVYLCKVGNPTFNIKARVYSNTTGPVPNAQLGSNSTTTLAASTVSAGDYNSATWTEYPFTFPADIAVTSGTTYWISLYGDGVGDASNYIYCGDNYIGAVGYISLSAAGSSWSTAGSKVDGSLKLYSFG